MRFSVQFIAFISTLILARLLTPEDFGVVALAGLVVAALEMLTAFGFEVVLVRAQSPSVQQYNAVWTLSIMRGAILALITASLGPFASEFFSEPKLKDVFVVIASATLIQGFANVGIVDFQRNLQFNKEYHLSVTTKVISFIITITLALIWRNYWALVFGTILSQLARTVLSYVMHPFRPRLAVKGIGAIFSFSSWLLTNNILHYAITRLDGFFVGKVAGTSVVGEYTLAFEVSNLATTQVMAPIRRAILPGFSKVLNDKRALMRLYIDTFSLMLIFGLPVAAGIAAAAAPIVHALLGDKWIAVIPLLKILALCGVLRMFETNAGPLFLALGKPHIITVRLALSLLFAVPLLVWLTPKYGAIGAAVAVTVTALITQVLNIAAVLRELPFQLGEILRPIWRMVVASALMYFSVDALQWKLRAEGTVADWLILIASVMTGVVMYTGVLFLLWQWSGRPRGAERLLLNFIQTYQFRRK